MKRTADLVLEPVMVSPSMRELDRTVQAVAAKDVIVTLIGESGSGKEVIARRIHDLSHRRTGPFVPINCAAIPEPLFESELFGHERGAFTGATERVRGKVEASAGGTLFLDELGELPLPMQAKLLRFLDNRKFMRVGGSTKISVDTRLVCATLRPLELEVQAGRFRADLYYRIEGITLDIPPLRERPADIAPLARQFVAELSALHGVEPPKLGPTVFSALERYAWPGNVRQLRNTIERLCLLRSSKAVKVLDLPALQRPTRDEHVPVSRGSIEAFLDQPLERTIHQILLAVLDAEGGNRTRTAKRLGLSLRTVQRYLQTLSDTPGQRTPPTAAGRPRSRKRV
jgi:transcriptional regulator with PAS, ATPase and Fis domain